MQNNLNKSNYPPIRNGEVVYCKQDTLGIIASKIGNELFFYELGRQRFNCFMRTAKVTKEPYGLDEYDNYYKHLILINTKTNELIGAVRFCFVHDNTQYFDNELLYTQRFWNVDESFYCNLGKAMEIGRIWLSQPYRSDLRGMSLIWKILAKYVVSTNTKFVYGSVPLTGINRESLPVVTQSLMHKHSLNTPTLEPKISFETGFAQYGMGITNSEIRDASEEELLLEKTQIPVLLKYYLKNDAGIVNFPAWDNDGKRVLLLILHSSKNIPKVLLRT